MTSGLPGEDAPEPEECEKTSRIPLATPRPEDIELSYALPQGKAGQLGDEGPDREPEHSSSEPGTRRQPGGMAAGAGVEGQSIGSVTGPITTGRSEGSPEQHPTEGPL